MVYAYSSVHVCVCVRCIFVYTMHHTQYTMRSLKNNRIQKVVTINFQQTQIANMNNFSNEFFFLSNRQIRLTFGERAVGREKNQHF